MSQQHAGTERRAPKLTTADAVRYLLSAGKLITSDAVRWLARCGRLHAERTVSGQFLFTTADLDRFIAEKRGVLSRA